MNDVRRGGVAKLFEIKSGVQKGQRVGMRCTPTMTIRVAVRKREREIETERESERGGV